MRAPGLVELTAEDASLDWKRPGRPYTIMEELHDTAAGWHDSDAQEPPAGMAELTDRLRESYTRCIMSFLDEPTEHEGMDAGFEPFLLGGLNGVAQIDVDGNSENDYDSKPDHGGYHEKIDTDDDSGDGLDRDGLESDKAGGPMVASPVPGTDPEDLISYLFVPLHHILSVCTTPSVLFVPLHQCYTVYVLRIFETYDANGFFLTAA